MMGEKKDMEKAAGRLRRNNLRVAAAFGGLFFVMVGAAYASVPLYELFCRVTGYGGTTQRAEQGADTVIDRTITIRFDSNVNAGLPWQFKPDRRTITVKMGETAEIAYKAENKGSAATVGTSVFNVTPFEAGAYFNKIECFCFTEQALEAGEAVEMPVVFFVDPEMDKDETLKYVKEITLSYTFFPADKPEKPVASGPEPAQAKTKL